MEEEIIEHGHDDQTTMFFDALLGANPPDSIVNICVKSKNKGLQTFSFRSTDKAAIIEAVTRMREGGDIYYETCFQPGLPEPGKRGKAVDKSVMLGIWMDIDVVGAGHASDTYPKTKEEAMTFILDFNPSIIIETGGGYQSHWLFNEPLFFENEEDRKKAAKLVERFQRYLIDKGSERGWRLDFTGDLARLMRLPGTYNFKNNEQREVRIVHLDNGTRYSPGDFTFLGDNQEDANDLPAIQQASPPVDVYPQSNAEGIMEHCSFIKHCVDDAATLTETQWFKFISVISHCTNGVALCHQYSSPYPGYSYAETQKKIENVMKKGPVTCEKIRMDPNADQYCSRCPFQGHIKSPIRLGNINESAQLMIKGVKILVGAFTDPGLPLEKENLHTLMTLRYRQPETYARIKSALAKMNISVASIEQQMRNLVVEGDDEFGDVEFSPYIIQKGGLVQVKETQYGRQLIPLSNFVAVIKEQIIKDDGRDRTIFYKISGTLSDGTGLPDVEVQADEFRCMQWVPKNYGARAILSAGLSTTDHVRTAMQTLSDKITERQIFAHTGWKLINGSWLFLSSAGGLGKDGLLTDVEVELPEKLRHYYIAENPQVSSLNDSIRASLKILDLAPPEISIPLLCGIYRAPLEEFVSCNFTLYLTGATGAFKSALTALSIAHFGKDFHGENLPVEWISTANSIEKMAFQAKDCVFVIDDFHPGSSQYDAAKINAVADRIIRSQANKTGRSRMSADGNLRQTYISRSLIETSGEDIARGRSLRARMYIVDVKEGDIDVPTLSSLQKDAAAGVLVNAMAGYIKWLASQDFDEMKTVLAARKTELRDIIMKETTAHRRTPDVISGLLLGLEQFLKFTMDSGVYSSEQAIALWNEAFKTLIASDKNQGEVLEAEDPVVRFLNLLMTSFLSGTAHVQALSGGMPAADHDRWGWKTIKSAQGDETKAQGKLLGWIEGKNLYIDPDASFAAVQEIAVKQGSPITLTQITLRKGLCERGVLIKSSTTGKMIKTMTISKVKRKVMHLIIGEFDDEISEVPNNVFDGIAPDMPIFGE